MVVQINSTVHKEQLEEQKKYRQCQNGVTQQDVLKQSSKAGKDEGGRLVQINTMIYNEKKHTDDHIVFKTMMYIAGMGANDATDQHKNVHKAKATARSLVPVGRFGTNLRLSLITIHIYSNTIMH